jgi:hypothetical protein
VEDTINIGAETASTLKGQVRDSESEHFPDQKSSSLTSILKSCRGVLFSDLVGFFNLYKMSMIVLASIADRSTGMDHK